MYLATCSKKMTISLLKYIMSDGCIAYFNQEEYFRSTAFETI